MIIGRIHRITNYYGLMPEIGEAVEFALSLTKKPAGRYEYDRFPEGKVYVLIQEGATQPYESGKAEAHRRYLDVQFLLEGKETVYYADIESMKEAVPYDEAKDIAFYEAGGQPARIEEGMFYAAFPHDGHMPCRDLDGTQNYRKIVLKIRI